MAQSHRGLEVGLIADGVEFRLKAMGIVVRDRGTLPHPQRGFPKVEESIAHQCFEQWEELFPYGVPVFRELVVSQEFGTCWLATLPGAPYWTDEILLLHEGTQPDLRRWRMLHCLEAASLLANAPGLGAVRYASPKASYGVAEIYILRNSGKAYVQCGNSPKGHHAAYTTTPEVQITERKI